MNQKSFPRVALRTVFVVSICMCLLGEASLASEPVLPRCKYSVRDVAFVNVHGKSWQLQLIKPKNVEAKTFAAWNSDLRMQLDRSNVGYVWLEADSNEATSLQKQYPTSHVEVSQTEENRKSKIPQAFLAGPDGRTRRLENAGSFSENIQRLIASPGRTKVLEQVVDSLCVLVVFESGVEARDTKVRETVESAIQRINKQMWTLEKPTDKGPAMVVIGSDDPMETVFVSSVGVESRHLPAVAVIYGQGRRLGGVLVGNEIRIEKLVGRASICGQDCECELNRDWLYQAQMIHVWTKQLERDAENSLSFDPQSAFVIAEVAQIISKNSNQLFDEDKVDLGGGLIVHDLEPVNGRKAEFSSDSDFGSESKIEPTTSGEDSESVDGAALPTFPWALLVGLVAITMLVLIFKARM